MGEFELLERDGLARLGRLPTPHGAIETPALLPVVHPDPSRQPVSPTELRRRFGLAAVITSSYITWRTPELRSVAEEKGIHGLLQFDGPVMTDSGAFQQHAYGHVEVEPFEILAFQRRIGSDIPTVLDIFVEPEADEAHAAAGVDETTRRARAARADTNGLLAVPVQGGRFPDLRFRSAAEASEIGDVLAVGGVVPLMERYPVRRAGEGGHRGPARPRPRARGPPVRHRPPDDVRVRGAPRGRPVRLLLVPQVRAPREPHVPPRHDPHRFPSGGDVPLLPVLRDAPPGGRGLPPGERERRIAEHNLLQCAQEVSEVRQAIRDGTLWELAERRAASHPALQAGLRAMVRGVRVFLATEPESRRTFRVHRAHEPAPSRRDPFPGPGRAVEGREGPRATASVRPARPGVPPPDPHRRLGRAPASAGRRSPASVRCPSSSPSSTRSAATSGSTSSTTGRRGGDRRREGTESPRISPASRSIGTGTGRRSGTSGTSNRCSSSSTGRPPWRSSWRGGSDRSGPAGPGGSARSSTRAAARSRLANDGVPRPTWYGAQMLHGVLAYPAKRLVVSVDAEEFVSAGQEPLLKVRRRAGTPPSSRARARSSSTADDRLLAVGRLVLAPPEMGRLPRAVAARVTAHAKSPEPEEPELEDESAGPGAVPPPHEG